jgi:hypothetical protein
LFPAKKNCRRDGAMGRRATAAADLIPQRGLGRVALRENCSCLGPACARPAVPADPLRPKRTTKKAQSNHRFRGDSIVPSPRRP